MSSVDKQPENLRAEITNELPRDISVSDVKYGGPESVVYMHDPKKLVQGGDLIRKLANKLRRRITVRPDPDVLSDPREVEPKVLSVTPKEAGVTNLDFHVDTGEVVIEAEKPGMVIGRHSSTFREITQRVGRTPEVVRTPPIESSTVLNVRNFLKQGRGDHQRTLEHTGRQIHHEQLSDDEWAHITTFGCYREVGRASFIVLTSKTRVLVSYGDKPSSDDVPYLQVPEALGPDVGLLDAAVLIHTHLDHSALILLLFEYSYDGPICMTESTRDLMGLLTFDYFDVASKERRIPPYGSEMVHEAIKYTIPSKYGDVADIAPDVKLTLYNAGHILGSAVPHFHIDDGPYNIAFSDNIHYGDIRLFNGTVNDFPHVEAFIPESTYGGRNDHQTDQQDSEERFTEVINGTYDRGGKVVIPTLAVGHSQEIMLVFEEVMRPGKIPEMPIHLDGTI